jgi:hypothetical protein
MASAWVIFSRMISIKLGCVWSDNTWVSSLVIFLELQVNWMNFLLSTLRFAFTLSPVYTNNIFNKLSLFTHEEPIYLYIQRIFATSYKYLKSILTQFYQILHIFTFKWTAIVLCRLHWLLAWRDWRKEPDKELTKPTFNMGLYSTHTVLSMFCYIVLCRYDHSDLQLRHCSVIVNHKFLSVLNNH